jgi:formylglycine-generating enzyme required for sulfatase activity
MADGKLDEKKRGVDGILGTAPVGSFKPNTLGFYDLGGNVAEWMLDGFDPKDPKPRRVLRGGNWWDDVGKQRSSFLLKSIPGSANFNFGFRIARGHLQSGEGGNR